jgi:UDP-3-O-[3-hydroxymyristoyl] glucosamine N-acyltransferase
VKFSKLVEIDSSLKILFGDAESFNLAGISNYQRPEENKFIFVKSARFLSSIGRLSGDKEFKKTGIVLEFKFFETIKETEDYQKIKNNFAWAAVVNNVNHAMCSLSKPFYDILYRDLNYYVDGRQMGDAQVHVDAQIAQNAFIGCNTKIGANAVIMPGAVIMPEVEIGDNTIIFPNVTVYPYSKIGKNCRIHASTVIGADGFGYNFIDGEHVKIWHLAGVVIEDNVEIGGATMVDAGAFMPTRIGLGSKLDNFCQISHNAQVGKHNVFAGQAGVAGSGETSDYCAFGAGAGLAPGARIGKGCQLAARTIVSENAIIPDGVVLAGHPARPLKEWLKSQAKIRQMIK